MAPDFHGFVQVLLAERRPFATATVIRVTGSASARPGSKAVIDAAGRNVFGWVGGGCAETLVREQALEALQERRSRIVPVDLDDEVLGVGMPCGGNMDVFIEPHFPARPLVIAGHNRLAQHLAALATLAGYAVHVHSPAAKAEDFAGAVSVRTEDWDALQVPEHGFAVIAADHAGHLPVLRRAVAAAPGYVALVCRRQVAQGLVKRLRAEGMDEAALAALRAPAGLHLGGRSLEEVSLSIVAEMMAAERRTSAYPLRMVKSGHAGLPSAPRPGEHEAPPELLIVGQGRIAEELARLGVLLRWPVCVNAVGEAPDNFPRQARIVLGDLDFRSMEINPRSHVVIATLHKGDHLSMERALQGDAPYIGLIASKRRAGLVLDYLRERGTDAATLDNVFAPAGLELGSANPFEIALSVLSEIAGSWRGGTCRPLSALEALPPSGQGEACRQLFQ